MSVEPRMVTASELAELLRVEYKTVCRHGYEIGGIKVGGIWRFDLDRVLAGQGAREPSRRSPAADTPAPTGGAGQRRRMSAAPHCQLLPVGRRGSEP